MDKAKTVEPQKGFATFIEVLVFRPLKGLGRRDRNAEDRLSGILIRADGEVVAERCRRIRIFDAEMWLLQSVRHQGNPSSCL
jgi:hypothetical protein